jgi:GT2 family glycosyltransferase
VKRPLTVVIPVFNAARQLERCLRAVAATLPPDTGVLVVDDASDDAAVGAVLARQAGDWTVLRNERNRGFVASANRGMDAAGDDDVILLNSDTVPAGDWAVRLQRALHAAPDVASATPFTNNGEIASLPDFCRANPLPDDAGAWARACERAAGPRYPELPTAVGFCMAIRRACLDTVGGFDEAAFGRGYGEENDWCMRASRAGWRHVLCDDAFVAHEGNASFGPLGLAPGDAAMSALLARHPGYLDRVRAFIDADPLRDDRRRVLEALEAVARDR